MTISDKNINDISIKSIFKIKNNKIIFIIENNDKNQIKINLKQE